MLGQAILDPHHVEGDITYCEALNYFPITTELKTSKTLTNVEGQLYLQQKNVTVRGYEIHAGISQFINGMKGSFHTLITIKGKSHGLLSDDNQIAGCYLHGFFDTTEVLGLIINWLGSNINQGISVDELENIAINRISDACQEYLDINKIEQLLDDWYKH